MAFSIKNTEKAFHTKRREDGQTRHTINNQRHRQLREGSKGNLKSTTSNKQQTFKLKYNTSSAVLHPILSYPTEDSKHTLTFLR